MLRKIWRGLLRGWYCASKRLKIWTQRCRSSCRAYFVWLRGLGKGRIGSEAEAARTLVICAHPDDETIFFSSVLEQEKPYVLCMSNCGDKIRSQEFSAALKMQNVKGSMMNLPDIKGLTWYWHSKAFARKMKKLRKYFPNVKTVYTHNTQGESGHPHHFGLGKTIKAVWTDCDIFCTASAIEPDGALPEEQYRRKTQAMETCYGSQLKMLTTWCPWYPDYMRNESYEKQ